MQETTITKGVLFTYPCGIMKKEVAALSRRSPARRKPGRELECMVAWISLLSALLVLGIPMAHGGDCAIFPVGSLSKIECEHVNREIAKKDLPPLIFPRSEPSQLPPEGPVFTSPAYPWSSWYSPPPWYPWGAAPPDPTLYSSVSGTPPIVLPFQSFCCTGGHRGRHHVGPSPHLPHGSHRSGIGPRARVPSLVSPSRAAR